MSQGLLPANFQINIAGEKMGHSLTAEQWAGIRAIAETKLPTRARVAVCAGVHTTNLAKRMAAEQWKCLDFRWPGVRAAYEQGVANAWAAQAAAEAGGEGGEPFDAGRGDAGGEEFGAAAAEGDGGGVQAAMPEGGPVQRMAHMASMVVRLCEQLLSSIGSHRGSLTRPQLDTVHAIARLAAKLEPLAAERAAEEQNRSDAEVAAVLQKIEDRIVYLAREYAKQLVAEQAAA